MRRRLWKLRAGEQDEESDVDICCDKPDARTANLPYGWAMFDEHARLKEALESALGCSVDFPDAGRARMQLPRLETVRSRGQRE